MKEADIFSLGFSPGGKKSGQDRPETAGNEGLVEAFPKKGHYINGDEVTSRNFPKLRASCFVCFCFPPFFLGKVRPEDSTNPAVNPNKRVENSTHWALPTFLENASGYIAAVLVCWIPIVFLQPFGLSG